MNDKLQIQPLEKEAWHSFTRCKRLTKLDTKVMSELTNIGVETAGL